MTRIDRRLLTGAALVAVYLVVAALTQPGPLGLRPLFDSFQPPPAYRWVKPPKELASSNQPPSKASKSVQLGATGSANTDVSTDDTQVLLSLPDGAIGSHAPDKSVAATVDPIDPGTLAPLPAPYSADGNAYKVGLTYQPSNTPVPNLAKQGSLLLRYPSTATVMLYSADGQSWQPIDTVPSPGNQTVLGQIKSPGYFVAAVNAIAPKKKGKGVNPLVVGFEIAGALVVVGIVVSLFRRPGQGRAKPVTAKRAGAKKAPAKKRPPLKKTRRRR